MNADLPLTGRAKRNGRAVLDSERNALLVDRGRRQKLCLSLGVALAFALPRLLTSLRWQGCARLRAQHVHVIVESAFLHREKRAAGYRLELPSGDAVPALALLFRH